MDFSKIHVSMFASAMGTKPTDRQLGDVLDEFRTGKYAARIAKLRQLLAKAYNTEKKKLPGFTVSGTAKNRKEPLQHSGLLQVYLDKLGGGLASLRHRLKSDPHLVFRFVSVGGEGLKLGGCD